MARGKNKPVIDPQYGLGFGMDFDEKARMVFWDKVKEEIGRREWNGI